MHEHPVPSSVRGLLVERVEDRRLNISWKEPAEPNDFTLTYTVTITDISTGSELSRTEVLDMDPLMITSQSLCTYMPNGMPTQSSANYMYVLFWDPFSVKGVPYNVTVFATNGRGKGPNVNMVSPAEEDGE